METWTVIIIILEIVMFLFVIYGFTHPSFEKKLIDLEDDVILKIKKKFGK